MYYIIPILLTLFAFCVISNVKVAIICGAEILIQTFFGGILRKYRNHFRGK